MVPRRMKSEAAEKPQLTREAIIDAALGIVDRDGYEKLSMRRLGAELKVDPMAIYYYFPNKSALLDGIVTRVMSYIDIASDNPAAPPEDRILHAARMYREALLRHPGVVMVAVARPPRDVAGLRPVETLLRIFRDAGFSPGDAMQSVNIFAAFVQGEAVRTAAGQGLVGEARGTEQELASLEEAFRQLPVEDFPTLAETMQEWQFKGYEEEFECGAKALIRGLIETYGSGGKSKVKSRGKRKRSAAGKTGGKNTVNSKSRKE